MQQITKFSCHSARQVPCLTQWEPTSPVYLVIYSCVASSFRATLDHKFQTMWADFCVCLRTINSCLLCVYPWCHVHVKMYQALPFLSGMSLGTRLAGWLKKVYCHYSNNMHDPMLLLHSRAHKNGRLRVWNFNRSSQSGQNNWTVLKIEHRSRA